MIDIDRYVIDAARLIPGLAQHLSAERGRLETDRDAQARDVRLEGLEFHADAIVARADQILAAYTAADLKARFAELVDAMVAARARYVELRSALSGARAAQGTLDQVTTKMDEIVTLAGGSTKPLRGA